MCFTISIKTTRDVIEKRFNADTSALSDFDFRYFFKAFEYPLIPVITLQEPGKVRLMHWGLIPAWSRDREQAMKIRSGTCNARGESLHEKPSFRKAATSQRCLVVVSGFFEWQHVAGQKIPWYIRHQQQELFSLAGIYDQWRDPATLQQLDTFSIVTTYANPLMEKIHNTKKRMPVILDQQDESTWITDHLDDTLKIRLLVPYPDDALRAYTIGKTISTKNADPSDPEIIRPVDHYKDGTLF
ncbi:MAG: SOS response-associated peptidase [Bacteroidales bacterium]|nr:SOS response-associated peptidase [Bacteroidales bacterium]